MRIPKRSLIFTGFLTLVAGLFFTSMLPLSDGAGSPESSLETAGEHPTRVAQRGSLHAAFPVASFKPTESGIRAGKWRPSTRVLPKRTITVVVLASWCPYSVKFAEMLSKRSDRSAAIDMVLFYESEFEDAISREVRNGRMTSEEGEQLAKVAKQRGLKLVSAADLVPFGKLPYFLIRSQERRFAGLSGYPSVFECDSQGCSASQLRYMWLTEDSRRGIDANY